MEESKATSSIQSGTVVVLTDTTLGEIRNIFSFLYEPKNVVQIQVRSV